MRHKLIGSFTVLLLGFGLIGLQAQESINTAGGNASGNGGTVSYSIGQVVYQTNTGITGSVTEGVQQPYEISTVTGKEQTAINLRISAYPNPTSDYITLEVKSSTTLSIKSMEYQLYNMTGQLLQRGKVTGKQMSIAMGKYVPANYVVKVTKNNNVVKTFKIIKN